MHPTSMVLVGLAAAATARPRGRQQRLKPAMPPPAACAPPKVKVVGKPPLKRQDEKFLTAVRAIRGAQDETRKTLKQLRSWKKNEDRARRRLRKKASGLPQHELLEIAMMKRMNEASGGPACPHCWRCCGGWGGGGRRKQLCRCMRAMRQGSLLQPAIIAFGLTLRSLQQLAAWRSRER